MTRFVRIFLVITVWIPIAVIYLLFVIVEWMILKILDGFLSVLALIKMLFPTEEDRRKFLFPIYVLANLIIQYLMLSVVLYLIFSFLNLEMNPAAWLDPSNQTVVVIMPFFLVFFIYIFNSISKVKPSNGNQ